MDSLTEIIKLISMADVFVTGCLFWVIGNVFYKLRKFDKDISSITVQISIINDKLLQNVTFNDLSLIFKKLDVKIDSLVKSMDEHNAHK